MLFILTIISIIFILFGFVNHINPTTKNKVIYKIVPRNVYDEIFYSLPISLYDKDVYDKMNPVYILQDENYKSLVTKDKYAENIDGVYSDLEDGTSERLTPSSMVPDPNITDKYNEQTLNKELFELKIQLNVAKLQKNKKMEKNTESAIQQIKNILKSKHGVE